MNRSVSPVTLGRTLQRLEVNGFVFTEDVHAPSSSLPPHAHRFPTVSLVRRGNFTETLEGQPEQCGPFSLIIKPAGMVHSDTYGPDGAVCFHIEVRRRRSESMGSYCGVLDRAVHIRNERLFSLSMRIQEELSLLDTASVRLLEGLVFELLVQVTRLGRDDSSTGHPSWLHRARNLIREHFHEPLTLARIANHVGVHPSYLARSFRKHYHSAVGDYLRGLRLDFVMRELMQNDSSLAEIASSGGFYDQSHLTQVFKRHTGLTPAKFRARAISRRYPGDPNSKTY